MTRPFAQRLARADRRREQYRNDPVYRIRQINHGRRKLGLPLLADDAELLPVGKMPRNWSAKVRDAKGRYA